MSLTAFLHVDLMLFKVGGDSFTRREVLANKVEMLLKQPWGLGPVRRDMAAPSTPFDTP